jgi:CMP-N,N'-diacetyllegionaminic acid synthase
MTNLLFTICARAGSKGVKGKNVRNFLDIPISYYTLAAYKLFCEKYAKEYEDISLALNTDSEELHKQVLGTGMVFTYIKRKEALAGDIVSKTDVIKDTVNEMETMNNIKYDIVVDLDLTSPLRTPADIAGTIKALKNSKVADLSFSFTNARRLPFFNMVMLKEDGSYEQVIKSDYIARQQAPQCFDLNASIYAYANKFITNKNTKKVFDGKATGYKMMDTAILDIDSEEDFEVLEILARYFFDKHEDYGLVEKTAKSLLL